jgi:hypothetical protein
MALRNRVQALERRLRPPALVQAWHEVLTVMNTRWAWGWTPAEVAAEARARAATGEDPGTVLARLLAEQADGRQSAGNPPA